MSFVLLCGLCLAMMTDSLQLPCGRPGQLLVPPVSLCQQHARSDCAPGAVGELPLPSLRWRRQREGRVSGSTLRCRGRGEEDRFRQVSPRNQRFLAGCQPDSQQMDLDRGGLWSCRGGSPGGCMEAIVSKYNKTASETGTRRSWLMTFPQEYLVEFSSIQACQQSTIARNLLGSKPISVLVCNMK